MKRDIIIKEGYNAKGYSQICLTKNNNKKTYKVHRLVAETFIPNPKNKTQVNHKDENKSNNNKDNLEWCNCMYNIQYSLSKKVEQYDKNGNYIKTWDSLSSIAKEFNGYTTIISRCCKNKCKSAYGYVWRYKK